MLSGASTFSIAILLSSPASATGSTLAFPPSRPHSFSPTTAALGSIPRSSRRLSSVSWLPGAIVALSPPPICLLASGTSRTAPWVWYPRDLLVGVSSKISPGRVLAAASTLIYAATTGPPLGAQLATLSALSFNFLLPRGARGQARSYAAAMTSSTSTCAWASASPRRRGFGAKSPTPWPTFCAPTASGLSSSGSTIFFSSPSLCPRWAKPTRTGRSSPQASSHGSHAEVSRSARTRTAASTWKTTASRCATTLPPHQTSWSRPSSPLPPSQRRWASRGSKRKTWTSAKPQFTLASSGSLPCAASVFPTRSAVATWPSSKIG
ncbi:hypothetical protein OC842_007776, partial [Tilletia horrida]